MHTFAISEDPDEMAHGAEFYHDLHCLTRQNQSSERGVLTCDPSIHTMDHLDLTASNYMGNSIGLKRVQC